MTTLTTLTTCIALIRGINVGKARRLAMADLRTLIADCGGNNVRTLLNSGNAVFETADTDVNAWSQRIRTGIEQRAGFSAEVIVLSADNLRHIVNDNPLAEQELDSARYLVAFVADPQILDRLQPLSQNVQAPEQLFVGRYAAYLWCADGIMESKILKPFNKLTGDAATTRNWATVQKLLAMTT